VSTQILAGRVGPSAALASPIEPRRAVSRLPLDEDAAGYGRAFALLGTPDDILVGMEATSHNGSSLHGALCERA
jgi:hypothetical protein